MNEIYSWHPYSPSEMPPAKPVSRATIKTFLGVITIFVIAQMVVTILYILHLHLKLDKMSNELTLHEDYVFLKRVQSCRKPQGEDISFLDCVKISESFRELMDASSSQKVIEFCLQKQKKKEMERRSPVASPVLHWKNTTYAPKDDVFSNRDGKITISKGGRYYIYAQVTFCSKPELHAPLIFKVHVYLDLPLETHQLLMKGVGTYNTAVDLCDLQSIHLSRAVELQSGHTIFVNVTDISRVDFNYGYTYFGLIQLS
uniref:CD40 ligand n=1 Tax=Laticauda laticaudata TaxID=8630 RepID=A0A8C5RPU5_LATLA